MHTHTVGLVESASFTHHTHAYTLTVELVGSVSLAKLNFNIQVRHVHISLAEINFHVHVGRYTYEPYLNFYICQCTYT